MIDRKLWINITIILCVSWLITFSNLGNLPLFDPDEPVYAETALEMLQNQDFISPRIYGDFWYDKPPMYYWLVAGAFKLFGAGEFAARFPAALLAVLGSILLYLAGRKIFNDRVGLLAALILSTSLEYFYLSRAAVTDSTLTFFITGALLAFLLKNNYMFYGCAALAVVTKGPIGVFFCGVIVGLYLLLTSNLALLKRMKLLSGGALFTVIAAPWYLIMYYYHGMDFINTFLGFHNFTRFLQPEHATGSQWYYYIPVLIMGFFPWTAFFTQAFIAGWKEKGKERNQVIFLMIWASVVFLFFSLSQTKLVSYILPMYPPLALLIAWYFDKAWTEKRSSILKWSGLLLAIVVILLEVALFYAGGLVMSQLVPLIKITAVFFLLLVALVWWLSYRRNFGGVFIANVIGMMFFTTFLITQLFPVLVPAFTVKGIVNEFEQHYDGQAPVYVAKFYRPGFIFYSGMPGIEFDQQDLETTLLNKTDKSYFIIKKKSYQNLPSQLQKKVRLLADVEDKVLFVHEDNK
ncbi:ArnT family glycosyltransferase [Pelosinus sp. sgz500959]|uniref:ArnT family glycosyltransferase n=1 Tax=Pelosinus sp. sgz500959 TaxID=3242472 RepID=UPI00367299CA